MLAPIRIIIHDFPNFLSEYVKTKLFAVKANAAAKINLFVHPNKPMHTYVGKVKNYAVQKLRVKGKFRTRISIKGSASPGVKLKGKLRIKNAIKARSLTKVRVKGKISSSKMGRHRAYLIASKYYIGITLTLEHWDDKRLEDIDGITMGDMSIIEV